MKWLILGAGITGRSLAKYFLHKKISSYIYDDRTIEESEKRNLLKNNTRVLSLDEAIKILKTQQTTVIKSPGITKEHLLIKVAIKEKSFITNEIDFTLNQINPKIIAITGTNGKSTIASMCYHILKENQVKAVLAGNIGIPVSSLLTKKESFDVLVLELSSYQLEQMSHFNFSCAIFSNFSNDHLERHKTLKEYFKAKLKIFKSIPSNRSIGLYDKSVKIFSHEKNIPLNQGVDTHEILTKKTK